MSVIAVRLGGRPDLPLLVLGPSLGTSAVTLWSAAAQHLAGDFQVVAWDLPGHGTNHAAPDEPVTVESLAADVLEVVDTVTDSFSPMPFHYAGVSLGGAVGLQLLLDAPGRIASATLLGTGARIGTAPAERWFGPGFAEREPDRASALLEALAAADATAYAALGEALAAFDVRDRLGEVGTPVLAVAGAHDAVTTPADLAMVAEGVRDGRLVVLDDVAHLAPAEAPATVARLVRAHALEGPGAEPCEGSDGPSRSWEEVAAEQASGSLFSRPGLDRRSRSILALGVAVAGGLEDVLEPRLAAARVQGLTAHEAWEVVLQAAVQGGLPADAPVLRAAHRVLAGDLDG
ncbi:MAG: alpha/beta fold hydrolase [Nocardioides sp.]